MSSETKDTKPVPSEGAGFHRIVNEIERYGRNNVADAAGVSYQTICNFIWELKTSESTRRKIAIGLFKAAQNDLVLKKAEVLKTVDTLQKIVDAIREELGEDFLSESVKSSTEEPVLMS